MWLQKRRCAECHAVPCAVCACVRDAPRAAMPATSSPPQWLFHPRAHRQTSFVVPAMHRTSASVGRLLVEPLFLPLAFCLQRPASPHYDHTVLLVLSSCAASRCCRAARQGQQTSRRTETSNGRWEKKTAPLRCPVGARDVTLHHTVSRPIRVRCNTRTRILHTYYIISCYVRITSWVQEKPTQTRPGNSNGCKKRKETPPAVMGAKTGPTSTYCPSRHAARSTFPSQGAMSLQGPRARSSETAKSCSYSHKFLTT